MNQAQSFEPTLNKMGGMTPTLDPYGAAFVEFAAGSSLPVLDIGAAYGVATHAALQAGATVISNDIDARHLEILLDRTPDNLKRNLTILPGEFPAELDLDTNSLGAILMARMLHFLPGTEITNGLAKAYDWLAPGGKVFAITVSPYLKYLTSFVPTYEKRKAEGQHWPGWIDDVSVYDRTGAAQLPKSMNFFDPDTLAAAFERAGFAVEAADFFCRPSLIEDMRCDGREAVGLTAIRP